MNLEDEIKKINFEDEIKKLLRSTKRKGMENVIGWLEANQYFTGPASSKVEFHGCHEGGLAKHSYSVYYLFKEKNEKLRLGLKEDTVIITGLLHDACKAGLYQENRNKDGSLQQSKPYKKQYSLPMGHGEMSVYLLQGKGLKLTDQEALLIRWHMGPFDEGWMKFDYGDKVKEAAPAVVALFTADWEASEYLDDKTLPTRK